MPGAPFDGTANQVGPVSQHLVRGRALAAGGDDSQSVGDPKLAVTEAEVG
jgi:hypothetical protein